MRHKDLILQFWRELRENCFVPCFRQWKLEDLCYKSGDLVTEIYYMNQVSSQFWILLSWLYCISLLTSMCVCARVCVPLAHRKATSLPHHHPFGLFLGRGQAPNWNGLPTVSIMNLLFFFFFLMEKLGFFDFLCTPFFGAACCIWSDFYKQNSRCRQMIWCGTHWCTTSLRGHLFLGDSALLYWNAITVFTPIKMTLTKWKNNPEFSFGCPNMLNPSKETPQRTSVCTCVSWTHSLWRLYCSGCWHAYRWR